MNASNNAHHTTVSSNYGAHHAIRPRRHRRYAASISALLGLLTTAVPFTGHAATAASGVISGQRWTKAGSPYQVHGDLTINDLDIGPGVAIRFQGDFVFEVAGRLAALGTEAEPISFTRDGQGGWQGIYFNHTGSPCELRWCEVSGSVNSGIRIEESAPLLQDCRIERNSAPTGGGGVRAHLTTGTLTMQRCIIANNVVNLGRRMTNATGGGIMITGDAMITDCVIAGNAAWGFCGQASCIVLALGGGLASVGGQVTLQSCVVLRNSAEAAVVNHKAATIAYASGGGVEVQGGTTRAINCVLSDNTTVGSGASVNRATGAALAAASVDGPSHMPSQVQLVNCTVAANSGGNALNFDPGCTLQVENSIVFFNEGDQIAKGATVAYSDVQDGYAGTGNIQDNPVFRDVLELQLDANSHCIDAGNPAPQFNDRCFPPSLGGARNDMGAYGGPGACTGNECPVITQQPSSLSLCVGKTARFAVRAQGASPLGYQWYLNSVALAGQTQPELIVDSASTSEAGEYSVTVSNACGSVTSNEARLEIKDFCMDIRMYAGITISGTPGKTYLIRYSLNADGPWTLLTTITLDGKENTYFDLDSPFNSRRFYKAEEQR